MNHKLFLRPLLFALTAIFIVSCDKDFDQLGTDIVGGDDEHFGSEHYTGEVAAFNQALGPIASNNLPVNPLGFYKNSVFGDTQADFVTQLEMASINPTFNNTNTSLYQNLPKIDSVILNIPYFSHVDKTVNKDKTYILDSIHGTPEGKFKLKIYRSSYYLRDLDPTQALATQQLFYTDQGADIAAYNVGSHLNDSLVSNENEQFFFDKKQIKTTAPNSSGTAVDTTRSVPSMRMHLNRDIFKSLILNAPSGQLADNTTFKNYFRGLYFKTESLGNDANMAMINFKGGTITMYYKEDLKEVKQNSDGTTTTTYKRVNKNFVLNLKGNTVSLLKNTNPKPEYVAAISNNSTEQTRLYLKGGEGSIATLDLFGNPASSSYDTYSYKIKKNDAGNPVDENGAVIAVDSHGEPLSGYLIYEKIATPNGIADQLDDLRYPLINDDAGQIYHSKKNRMMINEANLTFYVDQLKMANDDEPNRLYLYDLNNSKVLADYTYDFTTSGSYPKYNKYVFGGIYLNEKGTIVNPHKSQKAVKYKIKITNHIRNLIKNDSTNVRLGLSVTEDINNIIFSKRKSPGNEAVIRAPSASVMNPLGTVLYGSSTDVEAAKRLKLEVYYTKPKTN